jgi:hypothetical protein
MTRRQARSKLGSRTTRRAGTKTKVIPGGAQKQPPKYRNRRAAKGKTSNAAKVQALLRDALHAFARRRSKA